MNYIEEMGGWDEIDESDIEEIRQRVKKMTHKDWQQAYREYYKNPEVIEELKNNLKKRVGLKSTN